MLAVTRFRKSIRVQILLKNGEKKKKKSDDNRRGEKTLRSIESLTRNWQGRAYSRTYRNIQLLLLSSVFLSISGIGLYVTRTFYVFFFQAVYYETLICYARDIIIVFLHSRYLQTGRKLQPSVAIILLIAVRLLSI